MPNGQLEHLPNIVTRLGGEALVVNGAESIAAELHIGVGSFGACKLFVIALVADEKERHPIKYVLNG